MKKDLWVLMAIGGAVAIALAVAAARGVLPPVHFADPLKELPSRKLLLLFATGLAIVVLSGSAIMLIDRSLPLPSATLEWVYSGETARHIVRTYGTDRPVVVFGVLLDAFVLVPSYTLAVSMLSWWAVRKWGSGAWAEWATLAAWGIVAAAVLDWLENAGMLVALSDLTTRIAPWTYAICQLKWIVFCASADFALIAAAWALTGRAPASP